jgi:hypothetical protein
MSIVLPALAFAFAAFCVWLTVRIVNRRERWAKWMLAAVVGIPVLYIVNFCPACWLWDHELISDELMMLLYRPLTVCVQHFPDWFGNSILWWGTVGGVSDNDVAFLLQLQTAE